MTTAELLTVTPEPALARDAGGKLARLLDSRGLAIRGRRVLEALEEPVAEALGQAIAAGGLIVCVGEGEGAVVLRQALAHALGSRLVLSDRAFDALSASYAARGQAMPRRLERLALIPQGSTLLLAPAGGEPGILAEPGGALAVVLPERVSVAAALLEEHVLPRLGRRGMDPARVVRTLRLAGADLGAVEGGLAALLRGHEGATARVLEAGGEVLVRLRLPGPTAAAAAACWRHLEPALREALGTAWYGQGDDTLEGIVGRLLRARGLSVALAESCTGGLVGHRLTQAPGSSAYFERGLVVYSNTAKQTLLGVPAELMAEHGAVSAACAEAMARGVRSQAGTSLGISTTGIAGPDGGTPAKPVGTVFIGLADAETARSHHYRFGSDRAENKERAAVMALDLLRRYCLEASLPRGAAPSEGSA